MIHSIWGIGEFIIYQHRVHAGFFNPNHLAAFLVPIAIAYFDILFKQKELIEKKGYYSIALFIGYCFFLTILLTQSRSGILALFIGFSIF